MPRHSPEMEEAEQRMIEENREEGKIIFLCFYRMRTVWSLKLHLYNIYIIIYKYIHIYRYIYEYIPVYI